MLMQYTLLALAALDNIAFGQRFLLVELEESGPGDKIEANVHFT